MIKDLGVQPIAQILKDLGIEAGDLVKVSEKQLTYKMVSRACKGRRLNPQIQERVRDALNAASGKNFAIEDLFNYKS